MAITRRDIIKWNKYKKIQRTASILNIYIYYTLI